MIPESSQDFLIFRYVVVGLTLIGLLISIRLPTIRIPLALIGVLGLITWLYTTIPLKRPYGLQPGSAAAFELAVATSGCSGQNPLQGWVLGRKNPRPAWTFFWSLVCSPERPELVHRLYGLVGPLMLILLPIVVCWTVSQGHQSDLWEGACCGFSGILVSSLPLDSFRPFGMLFSSWFLVSPHRGLCLLLVLVAFGLAWRGRRWRKLTAGLLLGLTGWIDLTLFTWAAGSLIALDLLGVARGRSESVR